MKVQKFIILSVHHYPLIAKKGQTTLALRNLIKPEFNCVSLFSSHIRKVLSDQLIFCNKHAGFNIIDICLYYFICDLTCKAQGYSLIKRILL